MVQSVVRLCCAVVLLTPACSGSDDGTSTDESTVGPDMTGACSDTERLRDGRCVDAIGYLEPDARIDVDNVVSYADVPPTLDLPDPPKSGFRLVVPPRTLAPAEEVNGCTSWEYPEVENQYVYAARLYTNGMLHHSNMYGMPISPEYGRSEYPTCAPGQTDLVGQVPNWLEGNILDVLFANSTQIEGGEAVMFPDGMAFHVTTEGREVATSIHWLNTSSEEFTSEVVYDFYTTSQDQIVEEIVPFVFDVRGFTIPPQSTTDVGATCDITPIGNIVTMMPHNHERTSAFVVDLVRDDGSEERIFEKYGFDSESDIHVLDEPVSLEGASQLRYACTVDNELDHELTWGIGENEMCTFFGYLYPPLGQQLGIVLDASTGACTSLHIGQYR